MISSDKLVTDVIDEIHMALELAIKLYIPTVLSLQKQLSRGINSFSD